MKSYPMKFLIKFIDVPVMKAIEEIDQIKSKSRERKGKDGMV